MATREGSGSRVGQKMSCFEILNLLHVSSCEMFTFCDVLHEAEQQTSADSRECTEQTGNHLKVSAN